MVHRMSMSEPLLALAATVTLAVAGATLKKFNEHDQRVDRLELIVARDYLTKVEFRDYMDRLYSTLDRFEAKLDYHVLGDHSNPPKGYPKN